jgi:hypothetical protein
MRRGIVAVVGAALLAVAAPAAAAGPPRLTVTALGETVRATQGSFCWHEKRLPGRPPATFVCGDYGYPLDVKCRLPVAPGATVKVRTGTAVRRVAVALVAAASADEVTTLEWRRVLRSGKGRAVWRFEAPAEIGQAAALDISILGRRGDSNTWTGLATPACEALGDTLRTAAP